MYLTALLAIQLYNTINIIESKKCINNCRNKMLNNEIDIFLLQHHLEDYSNLFDPKKILKDKLDSSKT